VSDTVLVLNCGSSSVKYELIAPRDGSHVASGIVERVGEEGSRLEHTHARTVTERHQSVATHREALRAVLGVFDDVGPRLSTAGIVAVGHRVVMGGRYFDRAALVDAEVIETIDRLASLAPLHNPANLTGITVARELLPDVPHVAVFDTAFFHALPGAAATYALDRDVAAREAIRRYGAHGTSHRYVSRKAAELLGRDVTALRQIVLHLGNGASASAVRNGVAVDTSMGFTPLEGLVMGTRTGDIDAAVVVHLARNAGMSIDEIDDLLNRRSGMKGLTGHNDMREVHRAIAAGDAGARLALDVYVHRLRKYIGAYAAIMGGVDAVTFTAGVGENDPVVRAESTAGLGFLGIEIDTARNGIRSDAARVISPDGAAVAVLVVPTDEEMAIAQETMALLDGSGVEEV
jgi:acetate kinase